MQVYAMKFHNFLRLGEKNNTLVFDLTNEQKQKIKTGETTMDQIYDQVARDPIGHIEAVKERGIESQMGIIGIKGGDLDSSNGVGKSTILDGICYAHYEKIVRKTANQDKKEKAGVSVVTRLDGKYPVDLTESYVEEFFENNDSIYRLKRGRQFTKSQKSHSPVLEFECIKESKKIDKRGSHRTSDTAEAVANVIKMDYDVFVNSQMFGQNDAGKYLTGTDKIKKEMLIRLLQLEDVVVGCLDVLRKHKKEQKSKVDDIYNNIEFIENMFCKAYVKYSQQENNGFEKEIPKKIKEILLELRQKGEQKLEKCDEKYDETQTQINELSNSDKISKLANLKKKIEDYKKEKIAKENDKKERVSEWEDLKKASSAEIETTKNNIKNKKAKLESIEDSILKLKKQIDSFSQEECDKKLSKISKAKKLKPQVVKERNEKTLERDKIVESIASKTTKKNDLQSKIDGFNNQIRNVQDGENFICDKCKSKVSKEHILSEVKQCETSIGELEKEIVELTQNKKDIEKNQSSLNEKLEKIERYVVAETKIQGEIETNKAINVNLKTSKENKKELDDEIKSINETLKNIETKNKECENKIIEISKSYDDDIKEIASNISNMEQEIYKAKENAKDVEEELEKKKELIAKISEVRKNTNEKIGSLNKEISHQNSLKEQLEEKRKEYQEESKVLNRYLLLETIYGLEGIQTRIVKKYLPLLNVYIKEFLDILSDGTINVKMVVNQRGKIDMTISGAMADTYEMLSGGEKVLVRLAVDIGLALLSFSRSSQKPEIICLDEIFGSLDNHNKEAVFKMLEKLQEKFSRVIIITHNPAIQEKIRSNIIVEKSAGIMGLSEIKRIE